MDKEIVEAKMKKLLFLILTIMILVGCGSHQLKGLYHVKTDQVTVSNFIPVWIDARFSPSQVKEIRAAVDEYNWVFGGQITITVQSELFTSEEEGERLLEMSERTHQGIVIFDLDAHDPLIDGILNESNGTLAFVMGTGSHFVVVVRDQLGIRDLKAITLHEMSHIFGMGHLNIPSIMNPYYGNRQYKCLDKITVWMVANYLGLDFGKMHYCSTPYFE